MSDFQARATRYHQAIREVLMHHWDPVGVADIPEARDEYDAYVPGVYKRLISRSGEEEIFDYLWEIETGHMGLCGDRRHTEKAVKALLRLIDTIESREGMEGDD